MSRNVEELSSLSPERKPEPISKGLMPDGGIPIIPVGAPDFLKRYFENTRSIGAGAFVTVTNEYFAHVTTEGCKLHRCILSLVKHTAADRDGKELDTSQLQCNLIDDAIKEGMHMIVPRMRVRGGTQYTPEQIEKLKVDGVAAGFSDKEIEVTIEYMKKQSNVKEIYIAKGLAIEIARDKSIPSNDDANADDEKFFTQLTNNWLGEDLPVLDKAAEELVVGDFSVEERVNEVFRNAHDTEIRTTMELLRQSWGEDIDAAIAVQPDGLVLDFEDDSAHQHHSIKLKKDEARDVEGNCLYNLVTDVDIFRGLLNGMHNDIIFEQHRSSGFGIGNLAGNKLAAAERYYQADAIMAWCEVLWAYCNVIRVEAHTGSEGSTVLKVLINEPDSARRVDLLRKIAFSTQRLHSLLPELEKEDTYTTIPDEDLLRLYR